MKSWTGLEADVTKILNKNYSQGRKGRNIEFIVLHHNAGNLTVDGCYSVWQTRQASAHYQVQSDGLIGQLVHDWDTAWHAGNANANLRSIGIEHADESTNPWRISEACLDNGAHLVAALCFAYRLGRPAWKKNVFPHSYFYATACPASIQADQLNAYMDRAQKYYDEMISSPAPSVRPAAYVAPNPDGKLDEDGLFGHNSVKKAQELLGSPSDGEIWGQPIRNRWCLRNFTSIRWGSAGSPFVRILQEKLGVDNDGYLGPNTIKALQRKLGAADDGIFGHDTAVAWQRALNAGRIF